MTSYCMFQILSCNGPPVFLNPKSELSFGLPNIMPLFMLLAHQFKDYILGLAVDWSSDVPSHFVQPYCIVMCNVSCNLISFSQVFVPQCIGTKDIMGSAGQ